MGPRSVERLLVELGCLLGSEKAGDGGSPRGTALADFVSIKLIKLTCLCV